MRDGWLLEKVHPAQHRGQAIICACDAALNEVSLMDTPPTQIQGYKVVGLLCGLDLLIWWRVGHNLVPSASRGAD